MLELGCLGVCVNVEVLVLLLELLANGVDPIGMTLRET
jgi:hypothetical protein